MKMALEGRSVSSNRSASDDDVRIGMFHPHAGTRSAGGIAVYTRRLTETVSELTTTFLYTRNGRRHERLESAPLNIVGLPATDTDLPSRVPIDLPVTTAHVLDRAPVYAALFTRGVSEHIHDHLDVMVVHDLLDDLVLSSVIDIPTVRILHGLEQVGIGGKIRETFSPATATVANSRNTAREIESKLGYEPDGIVPPGVDTEAFRPGAPPAFTCDETAVLYAGRIRAEKGTFDLLNAFARVSDGKTLHVVGRGQTERLKRCARELGIAESVVVHGTVPHPEMPGYYTACDVFCNPSHYESFGMATLEAMACGAPVLSTDLDGTREYLIPGETGVVVPPGDREHLARRIDELASSPSLRTKLGRRGRETAQEYTWDASAERLRDICASVGFE